MSLNATEIFNLDLNKNRSENCDAKALSHWLDSHNMILP